MSALPNQHIPNQYAYSPAVDHQRGPDSVIPQSATSATGHIMHHPNQMMPTPSTQQRPEPSKYCGIRGNYQYELVIDQQPVRARMCGFGDKDRRPITPPPCIRVVVRDCTTGKEIPASEIDPTFFVLSVDLWDHDAQLEKNIVRTSSNTPAVTISTATTTSFPPQPERQPIYSPQQPMVYPTHQYQMVSPHTQQSPYQQQQPQNMYPQSQPPSLPPIFSANPSSPFHAQAPRFAQSPYSADPTSATSPAFSMGYPQSPAISWPPSQHNQGMYTRNLIGSLTVNAFTLKDDQDQLGIWFVLQDLSVRTEAMFRLKMTFVDIGTHTDPTDTSTDNKLHPGKAPVLASVFSQPFQVFSAKKFPGVIESTPLSKCFAQQGIKIPIRKDGAKGEPRDDED